MGEHRLVGGSRVGRAVVGMILATALVAACASSDSGLTAKRSTGHDGGSPSADSSTAPPDGTVDADRTDATDSTDQIEATTPSSIETSAPDAAEATAALKSAYESFDPNDVDATIARAQSAERGVELAIAADEGMDADLGGADATAEAYKALDAQFAPLGVDLSKPVTLGLRPRLDISVGVAEGLVGGVIVVGLGADAVVTASNNGITGNASPTEGVTATVTDDKVVLDVDATYTADGVTSRLKTHVELNPCPDPDGILTLKSTVDVTSKTANGAGQTAVLDVDVTAQMDDDARVSGTDDTFRMRRTGLSGNSFWDVTVGGGVGETTVNINDFNWFTSEIKDRDDTIGLAAILGQLIKKFMLDAAAKGYESGRCIDLQIHADPGPTGLDPDQTSTLTAEPRGKKDGAEVGGTVTAKLTGGTTKVEPSDTKVDADATFTFTAPDDVDLTGTVSFESRSKRGVGKAELTLDTKQDCILGDWTLDNDSLTAILDPAAQQAGGTMVATGGPVVTTFREDGSLTHVFNGFTITTEVPQGSLVAVYNGADDGTWKRNDDGSYVIASLQTGVSVIATVAVAGLSAQVPVDYRGVLQPGIALSCKDDQLTAETQYGAVTLTRVK